MERKVYNSLFRKLDENGKIRVREWDIDFGKLVVYIAVKQFHAIY